MGQSTLYNIDNIALSSYSYRATHYNVYNKELLTHTQKIPLANELYNRVQYYPRATSLSTEVKLWLVIRAPAVVLIITCSHPWVPAEFLYRNYMMFTLTGNCSYINRLQSRKAPQLSTKSHSHTQFWCLSRLQNGNL